MSQLRLLGFCYIFLSVIDAKTVVLLSAPHLANVRTHTNVGRDLVDLGHQPYVCIPQYMLDSKMVNTKGINVIAYGKDYMGVDFESGIYAEGLEKFWNREAQGVKGVLHTFSVFIEATRNIVKDEALRRLLSDVKPDLMVLTNFPPFANAVVLPYILDIPFAFLAPWVDFGAQRMPFSPPSTSCALVPFTDKEPSFFDRGVTTLCHLVACLVPSFVIDDALLAEVAPEKPYMSIKEITNKVEIYLVESDYILDYPRPQLPYVKYIGGTSPTPAQPTKDPFKAFMEKSKNGVVVVTFGSSVVDVPDFIVEKMTTAFLKQDLDVIWRVNASSKAPQKILASRWIPQNDLLGHNNTKLFVSHCGSNGQYESLYHGVPMLCLPLLNDGFHNAQRSESKGFGLTGHILDITAEELAALMTEVVKNPIYSKNIQKASKIFRHLFKLPTKEAAYWIDHVMEYGGGYMRSVGQDLPLYQFLSLDLLLAFLFLISCLITMSFRVCRCFLRLCFKGKIKGETRKRDKRD